MKKVLFSAALLMAAATVSFAGNPKGETKDASASATKTKEVTTKWFHFIGDANSSSDLTDQSMYQEVSTPICDETPRQYRCDILILTDPNDDSLPDLTKTPVQERKRATATE